jgi:galactokinase
MIRPNKDLIEKLLKTYQSNFDVSGSLQLIFSPGRINLLGEHVDYNDGIMLPAAIDLGIYFLSGNHSNSEISIHAVDLNETIHINPTETIRKLKHNHWSNYLLGVLSQFQKRGISLPSFQLAFSGDVPLGAGLSSSAALESGMAFLINELTQANLTKKELALIGQRAEHDFVGVKCGIMDQTASILGKENHLIELHAKDLSLQYLPLELEDHLLVLVDSKVEHALASSEYNTRRAECDRALNAIEAITGKDSYSQIDKESLERLKTKIQPTEYQRALYVINEIDRVKSAIHLIKKKQLKQLGQLMNETHLGLSNQYEVSCDELDYLQLTAMEQDYVLGSRMMGGGFGGCTINLIQKGYVDQFIDTLSRAYTEKFHIKADFIPVHISNGTAFVPNHIYL